MRIPLLVALLALPVAAQDDPRALVVGTKEAPPFAMRSPSGEWSGLGIELWEGIAADLGYRTEWRELPLDELFAGLERGELDAAVAAITVTSDREERVDFSHPYFDSGLGIAAPVREESGIGTILRRVFSWRTMRVVGVLVLVVLAVGLVVWLAERRRNEEFRGKGAKGIGSGLWWSFVTLTTVGYGDKSPRTVAGRFIAVVWMLAGLFLIASFTAAIASALTLESLETNIQGLEDLRGKRAGVVSGATGEDFLARKGYGRVGFPSTDAALDALAAGKVDAVVHDRPLLRYLALRDHPGEIVVLERLYDPQKYAIALRLESPLRKDVNRALLTYIRSQAWADALARYLGESE